ncbi:MAG: alanyl-tRNA editing protein [Thermoplasmata archaeon]
MTELAYLPTIEDAYVREFRARILARPPGGVVLDRTYFYPTGGGQACDRGTIAIAGGRAVEVVDVAKRAGSVVHRLRGPPEALAGLQVGVDVIGRIDWEPRHRHMRLHTGQHYLSARIYALYGIRTRHATMREREATLDLESPLPEGALPELAEVARRWAEPPRAVSVLSLSRAEWDRAPGARSGLVPLAPGVDPVRLIEIADVDRCPCGGTHVRSTLELGAVAIHAPVAPAAGGGRLTFALTDGLPPSANA